MGLFGSAGVCSLLVPKFDLFAKPISSQFSQNTCAPFALSALVGSLSVMEVLHLLLIRGGAGR